MLCTQLKKQRCQNGTQSARSRYGATSIWVELRILMQTCSFDASPGVEQDERLRDRRRRARARRRRNFCARVARRGRDDIGDVDAVLAVCAQPTLQTCNSLPKLAMRNREQAGAPCLEAGRFEN